MGKFLLIVVVLALLGGGVYLLTSQKKTSTTTTPGTKDQITSEESSTGQAKVAISNYAYAPQTIKVKAGETVTWTNNDSVEHSATADGGSFDTELIAAEGSAAITFDAPGTFTYHCTPHPYMKGTVIVE